MERTEFNITVLEKYESSTGKYSIEVQGLNVGNETTSQKMIPVVMFDYLAARIKKISGKETPVYLYIEKLREELQLTGKLFEVRK